MSLLGIPTEARLLILKHLFSDSRVVVGSRYDSNSSAIVQELDFEVLLTCKQVRTEGQELIAKSTQLVIYCWDYTTINVPTALFLTYIPYIESLTLSLQYGDDFMCQYFDPRTLPNLKVLNLIDSSGSDDECSSEAVLQLEQWLDILNDRNDRLLPEETTACLQLCRRNPASRPSRLMELASNVPPCTFKVIMHCMCRLTFSVCSEVPGGIEKSGNKTMIMEIHFDNRTREIVYQKYLEDEHNDVLIDSDSFEPLHLMRYLLDTYEDGAMINSLEAMPEFRTFLDVRGIER